MTPAPLVALVARALGRPATKTELNDWAHGLAHVPDDIADQALLDHRTTSTYPPTLADVRRHATSLLNDRAMRAETEQRRLERETGMTADGRPLVPMTDEVRQARADFETRQRARDAALLPLDQQPSPNTWPCCAHCPSTAHPPHRAACEQCTAPMDGSTPEAAGATR